MVSYPSHLATRDSRLAQRSVWLTGMPVRRRQVACGSRAQDGDRALGNSVRLSPGGHEGAAEMVVGGVANAIRVDEIQTSGEGARLRNGQGRTLPKP